MDDWKVCFKRGSKVTWRIFENECILLNLDTGFYYTLSDVGRFIWESLEGLKQLSEICEAITAKYNVDPETAKNDLLEIMQDLKKEHLVEYETLPRA
ncbi:MAG: PqqD family protein [Desulfoferrobacter sp.]